MPQIRKKAEQGVFLRTHGWQSRPRKDAVASSSLRYVKSSQSPFIGNPGATGVEQVADPDDQRDHTGRKYTASRHEDEPIRLPDSHRALEVAPRGSPTSAEGLDESRKEATAAPFAKGYDESTEWNCTSLKGSAILAVLPDGSVSGHLMDRHSKAVVGVLGVDVLPWMEECTRGEDWILLRLTFIIKGKELSFLAEREGRDALHISAPVNWNALDAGLQNDQEGPTDRQDVAFDFTCQRIETGGQAEERLAKLNRNLCGMNALINIGDFSARLPLERREAPLPC